jgi:TPR repeat protein/tetratricopeptide (TPR) repeat protein
MDRAQQEPAHAESLAGSNGVLAVTDDAPRSRRGRRANPHVAGNPVGGSSAFVGREDVLRTVVRALAEPQNQGIVLYGQRRIGKTSILQHLVTTLAERSGHRPVYFDLQDKAAESLDEVLADLAFAIAEALALPEPTPGPDVESWFRSNWLPSILDALPAGGSLVLLFDEFDVLADVQARKAASALFPYLRRLLDKNAPRLRVVFVIGRNIDDLENVAHALFKGFPACQVSLLSRKDAEILVRLSEANGSLTWSDEAVEGAWALTHGHPLLLQFLCAEVWVHAHEARRPEDAARPVSGQEVLDAVEPTLSSSRNAFEWLWTGLPPGTRVVAAALAQAGPEAISEETLHGVLHENGVRVIIRELREAPKLLVEWDLVETPSSGTYQFRVELLRRLIARYKPPARVQQDLDLVKPVAENMYRAGEGLYQIGNLPSATSQLREALLLNPNHGRASELLADILISQQDWPEARVVLERLYENNPSAARARLVQVLLAQAEVATTEDAKLELYHRVRGIDPKSATAIAGNQRIWRDRGNRARSAGDLGKAIAAYQEGGLSEAVADVTRDLREKTVASELESVRRLEENEAYDEALARVRRLAEHYRDIYDANSDLARLNEAVVVEGAYQRGVEAMRVGQSEVAKTLFAGVVSRRSDYKDSLSRLYMLVTGVDAPAMRRTLGAEKEARTKVDARLAALTVERDLLRADARVAQTERAAIGTELQTMTAERDRLRADVQITTNDYERLRAKTHAARSGHDNVKRTLDTERKSRMEADVRAAAFQAELDLLRTEVQGAQTDRSRTSEDFRATVAERDQLRANLTTISAEQDRLRSQMQTALCECDRLSTETETTQANLDDTRAKLGRRTLQSFGTLVVFAACTLWYGLQPSRIEVDSTAITLFEKNDAQKIAAAPVLRFGIRRSGNSIVWSTADPRVATVDADGTVKPVGVGHTLIVARDGGLSLTVDVTVTFPVRIMIEPSEVTLTPALEEVTLKASILATSGIRWKGVARIMWESSDPLVATIANGRVHRAGAGKTTIEARFGDLVERVTAISLTRREMLEKACDADQFEQCGELGYMFYNGNEGPKDLAKAFTLYNRACTGNAFWSCTNLGNSHKHGYGVAANQKKALESYKKACDGNNQPGCSNLGDMYANGRGVSRNMNKAVELYRSACDALEPYACWRMGSIHETGDGAPLDINAATEFHKKSCDKDFSHGCVNLATIYSTGDNGVAKNIPLAVHLLEKACNLGHEGACMSLGQRYNLGEGVDHDDQKARTFYRKACTAGNKAACALAPPTQLPVSNPNKP